MKYTTFIGIDPACKTFEASSLLGENPEGEVVSLGSFENHQAGIEYFLSQLHSQGYDSATTLICIEHIGPYNELLSFYLHQEGWAVWQAQPLIISRSSGVITREKTDKYDANQICRFAARFKDKAKLYVPESPLSRQLKAYFQLRKQLVKDRTAWFGRRHANQSRAFPCEYHAQLSARMIAELNKEISQLDDKIESLSKSQENLAMVNKILRSVPGIGKVITSRLIIVTGGMRTVKTFRQLSTLACSAPFPYQSGSSIKRKPRTSKKGDRKLKADLYMGAMRTTWPGQIFHQYYQHRIAMGKAHNSVINDIINKILKLAFDLCKKCELFDPVKYINNKKSLHFT